MGFSKYFMALSDKMWARGKEIMKYVLKRGGKMGDGFQVTRTAGSDDLPSCRARSTLRRP
jgi:hypothetical protein